VLSALIVTNYLTSDDTVISLSPSLSLIDHDLTEWSAKEARPALSHAPSLYVDIASSQTSSALDVQTWLQQRVVEPCHEAARLVASV